MLNMPHSIMSSAFTSICRALAFVALLYPLAAQPKVGYVEVYGVRKLSKDRILRTVGTKPGSELPRSKGAVEERLVALEKDCAGLARHLEANGEPIRLSDAEKTRKIALIHRILADDAEVRRHTQPWMEQVKRFLGDGARERTMRRAYGAHAG